MLVIAVLISYIAGYYSAATTVGISLIEMLIYSAVVYSSFILAKLLVV